MTFTRLIIFVFSSFSVSSKILAEVLSTVQNDSDLTHLAGKTITRLPHISMPLSYKVKLNFNVEEEQAREFSGEITIEIQILENTSRIILHAKSLTIKNAVCFQVAENVENIIYQSCSHIIDPEFDFLIIGLQKNVTNGEIIHLRFDYIGSIQNDDYGLFLRVYDNPDREKRYILATQFKPIGARHVLPCYDEPQYKASVQLNISHSNRYKAFSNMPLSSTSKNNTEGTIISIFQPTPNMSISTFAFAVGEFQTSNVIFPNTNTTMLTRPEITSRTQYANDISSVIQTCVENYLGEEFPLPKLDHLALPDLQRPDAGSWGLIMYNERNLLTFTDKSVKKEIGIALTIAHGVVHQWIGNLEAPEWWSNAWLSEGLATFLEYHVLSMVNNSWDMEQLFITSRMQKALATDINSADNSLAFSPRSNSEIQNIFRSLIDSKGACIFRMIKHVLTGETLQKAIRRYIKQRKNKTVSPEIMLQFLTDAANEDAMFKHSEIDLEFFLKSWTLQGGYPLVTVERDYKIGSFKLQQEPFDGEQKRSANDQRVWWIPFNYVTKNIGTFNGTIIDGYLDNSGDQTISPALILWTNDDWLILNKQQTGYYRVNYDATNWGLITEALLKNHESIHVINRAQLIDDAYHLVLSHRLPAKILLNILKYLVKEDEYAPWRTFENIWSNLKHKLSDHQDIADLKTFVKDLTAVPYKRLQLIGKPNDTYLRHLTRNIVGSLACEAGYEECLKESKEVMKNILNDKADGLYHDDKKVILCNGMMSATHLDFSTLLSTLVKSHDMEQRREYLEALGCMQDDALLRLYITTAMKKTFDINYTQDERLYVIKSIVQKSGTKVKIVIDFLLENTKEYSLIKAGKQNALLVAVQEIGQYVDKRLHTDFRRLLTKLEQDSIVSAGHVRPIERMARRNIHWAYRYRKPFVDWLQAYHSEKKRTVVAASIAKANKCPWQILKFSVMFSLFAV